MVLCGNVPGKDFVTPTARPTRSRSRTTNRQPVSSKTSKQLAVTTKSSPTKKPSKSALSATPKSALQPKRTGQEKIKYALHISRRDILDRLQSLTPKSNGTNHYTRDTQ